MVGQSDTDPVMYHPAADNAPQQCTFVSPDARRRGAGTRASSVSAVAPHRRASQSTAAARAAAEAAERERISLTDALECEVSVLASRYKLAGQVSVADAAGVLDVDIASDSASGVGERRSSALGGGAPGASGAGAAAGAAAAAGAGAAHGASGIDTSTYAPPPEEARLAATLYAEAYERGRVADASAAVEHEMHAILRDPSTIGPATDAHVTSAAALPTHGSRASITHITLSTASVADLSHVPSFTALTHLVIRGCGMAEGSLTTWANVRGAFAELVMVDIRDNFIANSSAALAALVAFVSACPKLEMLDVRGNPLCGKKVKWTRDLPDAKSKAWEIPGRAPRLRVLNGVLLPAGDRAAAVAKYNTSAGDLIAWRLANEAVCASVGFPTTMRAEGIVDLNVSACALSVLSVATLPNLRTLRAAQNQLRSVSAIGLSRCPKLWLLDLAANSLTDINDLMCLAYVPSLLDVSFAANRKLNGAKNYRLRVVATTRFCRGVSHFRGLAVLDGARVTLTERVSAVAVNGCGSVNPKLDGAALDMAAWVIVKEAALGQQAVAEVAPAGPGDVPLAEALAVAVPGAPLRGRIDVSPLKSLKVLDLSGATGLERVVGLDGLHSLQVLDLHGCGVRVKEVLGDVKRLRTLQYVSLLPPRGLSAKQLDAHVQEVLTALLPQNTRLWCVEGSPVSSDDRFRAWTTIGGSSVGVVTERGMGLFRATLVLIEAAGTPPHDVPSFLPNQLTLAKAFSAAPSLTELDLTGSGLQHIDLRPFVGLKKLFLGTNGLPTLGGIGIETMTKLQCLDVSFNDLKFNSESALSRALAIIAKLPALQYLALDSNGEQRDRTSLGCRRISGGRGGFDAEAAAMDDESPPLSRKELAFWGGVLKQLPQMAAAGHLKPTLLQWLNGFRISDEQIAWAFGGESDKSRGEFEAKLAVVAATVSGRRGGKGGGGGGGAAGAGGAAAGAGADDSSRGAMHVLDLSGKKLTQMVPVKEYGGLHTLKLSGNRFTGSTLIRAQLHVLPLRALDVTDNAIDKLYELAALLNSLTSLEKADVDGNPCFKAMRFAYPTTWGGTATEPAQPGGSPLANEPCAKLPPKVRVPREKLFELVERASEVGFKLNWLNGFRVGVCERIEALAASRPIERARTLLTLEHYGLLGSVPSHRLDLPFCNLQDLSPAAVTPPGTSTTAPHPFVGVRVLNLTGNKFAALTPLQLHKLPRLEVLDVRNNPIAEVADTIAALGQIHTLKAFFCAGCAPANLASPAKITKMFKTLRGVHVIEGTSNPTPLTPDQIVAANVLHDAAGVSMNCLATLDMTSRDIDGRAAFDKILDAMEVLGTVEQVSMGDNPFVKAVPQYRRLIIARLYSKGLERVDGTAVTEDQIDSALKHSIRDRESGGGTGRGKKLDKDAKARQRAITAQTTGAGAASRVASGGSTVPGGARGAAAASSAGAAAAGFAASSGLRGDELQVDAVARSSAYQAAELARYASGSALNKLELVINFLQVYGLVLQVHINLNLNIDWPDAWQAWRDVVGLLPTIALDLDFTKLLVFIPNEAYQPIKFGLFMLIPIVLFKLYRDSDSLKAADWRDRYYMPVGWGNTKRRVHANFVACAVLAVVAAFTLPLATPEVQGNMDVLVAQFEQGMPPLVLSLLLALLGATLFAYIVWRAVVETYRRNVTKHGPDSAEFQIFWIRSRRAYQRFLLFVITVAYMPVTTVLLNLFANNYAVISSLEAANSSVTPPSVSPGVPANVSLPLFAPSRMLADDTGPVPDLLNVNRTLCQWLDGNLVPCCLKALPNDACLNSRHFALAPLQYAAFPFILAYVIGIPAFFAYLVYKGSTEVVNAGFSTQESVLREKLKELQKEHKVAVGSKAKNLKRKIKDKEQELKTLWPAEVLANAKAQTYLYSAFSKRMRYHKILQMVLKLALLVASALVPIGTKSWGKAWASGAVLAAWAFLEGVLHAYSNVVENVVNTFLAVTNAVNMLLGIAVGGKDIGGGAGAGLLITINVLAFALAIAAVIWTPFSRWRARKRAAKMALNRSMSGMGLKEGSVADMVSKELAGKGITLAPSRSVMNLGTELAGIPESDAEAGESKAGATTSAPTSRAGDEVTMTNPLQSVAEPSESKGMDVDAKP